MDKKHWAKIQKLFRKATELPANERLAFIEKVGEENVRLAEDLEKLLASHQEAEADDFLENSPLTPYRLKKNPEKN